MVLPPPARWCKCRVEGMLPMDHTASQVGHSPRGQRSRDPGTRLPPRFPAGLPSGTPRRPRRRPAGLCATAGGSSPPPARIGPQWGMFSSGRSINMGACHCGKTVAKQDMLCALNCIWECQTDFHCVMKANPTGCPIGENTAKLIRRSTASNPKPYPPHWPGPNLRNEGVLLGRPPQHTQRKATSLIAVHKP